MTIQSLIHRELTEARSVLDAFLADSTQLRAVEEAAQLLSDALRHGRKLIACGNGGSHCDAMHFAEELSGRFRDDRPALAAIAISDSSHLTCVSNDYGYEFVFSRFIEGLGQPGDVLLAFSTSGNSPNVLRAVEEAHRKGLLVVALTGATGGKLAGLADVEIRVPHNGYADRIQEVHVKIIHILILLVERLLPVAGPKPTAE